MVTGTNVSGMGASLGSGRWATERIWGEERDLSGKAVATVKVFVVPASGVGWVDCAWRRAKFDMGGLEQRRILANWEGRSHASIVREVIKVADEWFVYAGEQAERQAAVVALSGLSPEEQAALEMTAAARKAVWAAVQKDVDDLAAPQAGHESVQGVLPALTGGAALGAPDGAGDGLGDLRDDVTEPQVMG